MRRSASAAALLCLARAAAADGAPTARAVRAARDAVMARPEFRYGPPPSKSFVEDLWDAWQEWIAAFRTGHPVAFVVVYAAMAVVLVALVAQIVLTQRMLRRAEFQSDVLDDADAAMRRGDASPFRARAVEHAAAGRYVEAVRDLYAALLVTLDRRGVVRYASSKALLDYRIEASRDAVAARTLDLFAATYHPGSFGRRPPDRAHFEALLAALDDVAAAETPR